MSLVRVIKNNYVVQTADPGAFARVFPEFKHANVGGVDYCAVPATLDHARVLMNLGFAAPPPIYHEYTWPGRFTPYPHQMHTAGFLTMNPRAFCLNGMGCISGDAIISTNRHGKTVKMPLRDLYKKWKSPSKLSTGNTAWKCRALKDDRFGLNGIEDVIYSGEKETLIFTLADGKTIRCTPNHSMAQSDGSWILAGDLRVGGHLVTNGDRKVEIECHKCGEPRLVSYYNRKKAIKSQCRKCKHKDHSEKMTGDTSPTWKGGKPYTDKDGYVRIYKPEDHRAGQLGRVYEHILVAEEKYGQDITPKMYVHHINGIKDDNHPENLELLTSKEHSEQHDPFLHLDGSPTINGGVIVVVPKQSEIISITPGGVTDVYDISMKAPHHNFVADGIVVHNSMKTISALWAADYLMKLGVIKKCLIISPLSTLERVWGDEIFNNFPGRTFAVLHGARQKRIDLLKRDADFYILNHDGLKVLEEHLDKRDDINLLIIDEVAVFRNATTGKWKQAKKLCRVPERWVWGLTGTPTPNAPTDSFGQVKLIKPENYEGHFTRFKNTVMQQLTAFRWIPRKGSEKIVNQIMSPSIRYALEDCVSLPETIKQDRQCELSKDQAAHYKEIKQKAVTEILGSEVTAINAAVQANKLLQISLGCAYASDGDSVEVDFGPRLTVLRECLEESDQKVLVFVPFTNILKALKEKLKDEYAIETIDGSTSTGKRNRIFKEFQGGAGGVQVIIANPETMAHGLTLTAATTIIWYGPTYKNEIYEQANARIVRPGQKNITNIINIFATPLERNIYKNLQEKGRLQAVILDLAKNSL